jgi:hypothetical protein
MRHRAGAFEADVGSEGDVAGDTLPDEVEGVLGGPDVGASTGDAVLAAGELDRSGLRCDAYIAAAFEDTGRKLLGRQRYPKNHEQGKTHLKPPDYLCSWQKVQSMLTFFA